MRRLRLQRNPYSGAAGQLLDVYLGLLEKPVAALFVELVGFDPYDVSTNNERGGPLFLSPLLGSKKQSSPHSPASGLIVNDQAADLGSRSDSQQFVDKNVDPTDHYGIRPGCQRVLNSHKYLVGPASRPRESRNPLNVLVEGWMS